MSTRVQHDSPKDVHGLKRGRCGRVTSVGKGDFTGGINLRPLKWGRPWLPGGTQCHHRVLIKAGGRYFPGGSVVKNLSTMWEPQEMWVQSLGWEDPLEESMATYSNILA